MIPKIFLVAFLSLQRSNPQSPKGNAALDDPARFDVLNEPTTTFHAAPIGSRKTVSGIEDLNSPKVQTTGDGSQVPIQISSGQDAVVQRGAREINVIPSPLLPSFTPQ